MYGENDLTAYCGLYCGDCIPSNSRLFELIDELLELSSSLCLEKYAGLLAGVRPTFADYAVFERVLSELSELRCSDPCRKGGGRSDCPIRLCARGKGFEGCWECDIRLECELLQPMRNFHGDNIDHNLKTIAEHGPHDWAGRRGKHYPWS
jgi:hypothetical protein